MNIFIVLIKFKKHARDKQGLIYIWTWLGISVLIINHYMIYYFYVFLFSIYVFNVSVVSNKNSYLLFNSIVKGISTTFKTFKWAVSKQVIKKFNNLGTFLFIQDYIEDNIIRSKILAQFPSGFPGLHPGCFVGSIEIDAMDLIAAALRRQYLHKVCFTAKWKGFNIWKAWQPLRWRTFDGTRNCPHIIVQRLLT